MIVLEPTTDYNMPPPDDPVVSSSDKSWPDPDTTSSTRTIGPYRIGKRLGTGGMASVFEAVHEQLGKPVALKVPHPHIAERPRAVARFLREGKAAARIRHPHAVSVIDAGTSSAGVPYLVMELESGETLASVLRSFGVLDPMHAVDLLLPLLSAIQKAHSLGIVHRDIKPSNILIASDHFGDSIAKIADFGISRLGGSSAEPAITDDHALLGTLPYMAPEQIVAGNQAGPASDQYAMGAVLYECLTGTLPLQAEGTMELANAIVNDFPIRPRSIKPDIPEGLDSIVMRALEKAPEQRFATMRAFAEALLPFASEHVALVCSREFVAAGSKTARSTPSTRIMTDTAQDDSHAAPRASNRVRSRVFAVLVVTLLASATLVGMKTRDQVPRTTTPLPITASPIPMAPSSQAPALESAESAPSPPAAPGSAVVRLTPEPAQAPKALSTKRDRDRPRPASQPPSTTSLPLKPRVGTEPAAEDNGAPILD